MAEALRRTGTGYARRPAPPLTALLPANPASGWDRSSRNSAALPAGTSAWAEIPAHRRREPAPWAVRYSALSPPPERSPRPPVAPELFWAPPPDPRAHPCLQYTR